MKALRLSKPHYQSKKFVLRLPSNVHEKVFLTAKEHRRSMNAEIIHHLERTLPSSLTIEAQSFAKSDTTLNEEHCLSILRALPAHKRTVLFALLESLNS